MEKAEKIQAIKTWLGTGSINIFGIAFSGKDTVGKRLAEDLHAVFLSSGDIIRHARNNTTAANIKAAVNVSDSGTWMPTDEFRELILPYLHSTEVAGSALILSMVGRWTGEEAPVIEALEQGDHQTKAVVLLKLSEKEAWSRRDSALDPDSRNMGRLDDAETNKVQGRLDDFRDKTLPVIAIYRKMGVLVEVNGEQLREKVFDDVIDALYEFSRASTSQ
jgi:adenylate kinase